MPAKQPDGKANRMIPVLTVDIAETGPGRMPVTMGKGRISAKQMAWDGDWTGRRLEAKVGKVDASKVIEGIEDVLSKLGPLERLSNAVKGFELDELSLEFAINAEGGVELIGKATVGFQASVSVTLKPKRGP